VSILLISTLVGLSFGGGVWLSWQSVRRSRRAVASRVAPYVSDISAAAHEEAIESHQAQVSVGGLHSIVNRISHVAARRGGEATASLLTQAGRATTSPEWWGQRLLFTGSGAVAGLVAGSLYGFSVQSASPALGLLIVGGVGGWVLPQWALRRQARIRGHLLEQEMAAGLELIGLCVSAGEDVVSALARVGRLGSGPFSEFVRDALTQVALGIPVATALESSARQADVPALSRVVEHLTATLERGTPIVDVITAQIADVREEAKQRLIESAGRNEVLMLIPLVFLILPVTIAFAVYPGLIAIQSGL
jgi:tight adherence protein C